MLARHLLLVTVPALALIACSGGSAATIPSPAGATDATTGTPEPEPTPREGGVADDDAGGGARDASAPVPVVQEKPAPECHDVDQRGGLVTVTANPGALPPASPLTVLEPGAYAAVAATEYGTAATVEQDFMTTAVVTATRYYYLHDRGDQHDPITTTWSLLDGTLSRKVLCRASGIGQEVSQRIDASPNGFVIVAESSAGRPFAIRYERVK